MLMKKNEQYKTLLLWYLRKKNKIVLKYTRLLLTTSRDLKEVEEWSNADCKLVLSCMDIRIGSCICPWCLLQGCSSCGYGKRNGHCSGGRYSKIVYRLPNTLRGVSHIPEIKQLVTKTKNKYTKIKGRTKTNE